MENKHMNQLNLTDYGFSPRLLPENSSGIPARVTSVHKERFGLVCGYGEIYGRLKTREYYGGSEGLSNAFADVEQFLGKCRFRDCTHQSEPGCAIKVAIQRGELSATRWKSYCALEKEARYADDKADFLRQKQQWSKNLRKGDKNKKKEIW